jgi:hypothetical protein
MSKFIIRVTAGVANVYPYGQGSEVTKTLQEGEELLCQVPVGAHVEPQIAQSARDKAKQQAAEDQAVPAAGVADKAPKGQRAGTLLVAVTEGAVTLRTYAGADFTEQQLEQGASATVEVTETNHLTLAVYDAAPVIDPRG